MLDIGISSNNDCGKDHLDALACIKNAGFDSVMLAFKLGNAENLIIEARRLGLSIPFAHLSTKLANFIWARGEINKEYFATLLKEIELCGKYGIKVAIIHPGQGDPAVAPLPPNKFGLSFVKKLVKKAEECGVKIALENVDPFSLDHLTFLLDKIRSENFGFCYDSGHHNLYLPNENFLEKYGDRLLAVHLQDNLMDYKLGYDYSRDLHYLPKDGVIDFDTVCKNLADVGYDSTVLLEVHKLSRGKPQIYKKMTDAEFLSLARERALFLRGLIQKYRQEKK